MSRFVPGEAAGGMPVELYLFYQGATTIAELTSAAISRPTFFNSYVPSPIKHETIAANDDLGVGGLRILMPADDARTNPVVNLFRGTTPTGVVEFQLQRVSQGTAAVARTFLGDVVSAEFIGSQCALTVQPKLGAFKQRVLRQLYQAPCNHTLYDQFCGIVKANFSSAATVTAIAADGVTLTVPVASLQADGYYLGGQLQFGSRHGFIVAHSGSTLVLLRPVPGLAVSSSVTISAGCDRSIETCAAKFSNIPNHMGFPLIPEQNPFTSGVGATTP